MSAQLRQPTLSFHSSGAPRINRPGPRVKAPATLTLAASTALISVAQRQRLVSGINEQDVIRSVQEACRLQAAGLPDPEAFNSSNDD